MLLVVASGFLLAPLAPALQRRASRAAGRLLSLLPFSLAAWLVFQARQLEEGARRWVYPWIPSLDVALSFRLDGLSFLFALLVAVVGGLVILYASGYLEGHEHLGRIYAWLLTFMASMLGLVLADNLIALFVFWELTSLSSYLLIGFYHEREAARAAALQALLVTGLGGLALLAGFVLMGRIGSSFDLSALEPQAAALASHPLYAAVLLLVLAGAFTKSAQFPFHFWLPDAMEAPAPVSAYLHAAAMVKAGVYLVARLSPVLGGTPLFLYLVAGTGAVTMMLGAWLAYRQVYLKRILAYSTVSALGTLMLLLGLGTPAAVQAAIAVFFAHVLYKGSLFLAAGNVEHGAGTGEVGRLGGLARAMPLTAFAALAAAVTMAGLPPSFGFVAKESLLAGALEVPPEAAWAAWIAVAASALLIAVSLLVSWRVFAGEAGEAAAGAHEASPAMLVGPVALGATGFLLGLSPGLERLLEPAASAVTGAPVPMDLALWHGWNLPLALSAASLAAGLLLYAGRRQALAALGALDWGRFGPAVWYRATLRATLQLADVQTRLLQSGYLRGYLTIVVATVVGLLFFGGLRRGGWQLSLPAEDPRAVETLVVLVVLASVAAAVASSSRLGAIAALGAAGYGIALIFLLAGAPDLAITQFVVESLVVVLFVFAFYRLPRFARLSSTASRLRDVAFAGAVGVLMSLLTLAAAGSSLYEPISSYFGEWAYLKAHGRNIVNVILVDFRALDTLGEITVIGIAAMGVYALLGLRRTGGGA
jgi:multicomponent Na+:H+ antiporter subunit A